MVVVENSLPENVATSIEQRSLDGVVGIRDGGFPLDILIYIEIDFTNSRHDSIVRLSATIKVEGGGCQRGRWLFRCMLWKRRDEIFITLCCVS